MEYDEAVLKCFLEKQGQLYPEPVCETLEEADEFLCDVLAVVCNDIKEVIELFDDTGLDIEGMDEQAILEADEVFDIGDGRYLVVEG